MATLFKERVLTIEALFQWLFILKTPELDAQKQFYFKYFL